MKLLTKNKTLVSQNEKPQVKSPGAPDQDRANLIKVSRATLPLLPQHVFDRLSRDK